MTDGAVTAEIHCPGCSRFILEGTFELVRIPCRCGVTIWAHREGGVLTVKAVPRLTRLVE